MPGAFLHQISCKMHKQSISKYFKTIFLAGGSILLVIAVIYKLNENRAAAQNEIKQELKTVGYTAGAAIVKEISFSDAYSYRGTVEAGKIITLSSETAGKVVYSAIEKGKTIPKGSILARVDRSTRLSSYQISQDTYEKAQSDYLKLKELLASGNASGMEVENARLQMQHAAAQLNISKKQVDQTLVLAPETGVITDKKINEGEYVTEGSALGAMACLDEVLVNVFVPENEVGRLKTGAAVTVKADAYPGVHYTGKINAIIPVASAAKTFPVELKIINNQRQKLLAGMNVSVIFEEDASSKALVIPRSSLSADKDHPAVYLIRNCRQAVLTPIRLGKEYDTYISVTSGLKAGDTVMTAGLQNVEPGKEIKGISIQN